MRGLNIGLSIAVLVFCALLFSPNAANAAAFTFDQNSAIEKQKSKPITSDSPVTITAAIRVETGRANVADRVTETVARKHLAGDSITLPEAPARSVDHVPLY